MVVKSVNPDHLNESATVAMLDIWLSECLASVKVLVEESKKKDSIITELTARVAQLEKNSNNSCTTTTRPKQLDYASCFNSNEKKQPMKTSSSSPKYRRYSTTNTNDSATL